MMVVTTLPSSAPVARTTSDPLSPHQAIRRERQASIVLRIMCVAVPAICVPVLLSWYWFDTPLVRLVPPVFHLSHWVGVVYALLAILALSEAWWIYESSRTARALGSTARFSPLVAAAAFMIPVVGAMAAQSLVAEVFPTESMKGSVLTRWYLVRLAAYFLAPLMYAMSGFGEGHASTDVGLVLSAGLVVAAMALEIILVRQLLQAHRNLANRTRPAANLS
jgi:hypothetical protein